MSSEPPAGDAVAAGPSATVVAVIPAAGAGTRFGAGWPKQYAELDGQSLIERTIEAMLAIPAVGRVVVALAADDTRFASLAAADDPRVDGVVGGDTRAASVAAALEHVCADQGRDTWALVHDAARPLVAASDVATLIDRVLAAVAADVGVGGGILAVRVADTLKREFDAEPPRIEATVSRDGLWQAQTPQLFRAGALLGALRAATAPVDGTAAVGSLDAGHVGGGDAGRDGDHDGDHDGGTTLAAPTDEASAMERAGVDCLLVEARHPNPKITRPADLTLARALLAVGREERARRTDRDDAPSIDAAGGGARGGGGARDAAVRDAPRTDAAQVDAARDDGARDVDGRDADGRAAGGGACA